MSADPAGRESDLTTLLNLASSMVPSATQVTRLDTQAISNQVNGLHSRMGWVEKLLYAVIGLLIATYGTTAFFTWRLVELLAKSP